MLCCENGVLYCTPEKDIRGMDILGNEIDIPVDMPECDPKMCIRDSGDTVLQNRGILSDRELRCIQQFIKENYREMYLKWSRLSEEGFYQND